MKTIPSILLRGFVRLGLGLVLLVGLVMVLGGPARHAHAAQTLTITDCSTDAQLQAAIAQANSDNAGDTIKFGSSGVIYLTQTLSIRGSMTLDGSGQNVTLDGQNQQSVLVVVNGASFTLKALTIAHGSYIAGAGIYNNGTANISNSTFANNSASSGAVLYNNGTANISNSTFANNSASSAGGGIYNGGTVTISSSTFTGNSADVAAVLYNNGMANISNSTIANNSANFKALNISSGTVKIGGSIVANNVGGNCWGGPIDQGYNLESGTDCGFTGTGSLQNTDPKLDPNGLQSNGGLTQTIALLQDSPAIDRIPATGSYPTTDQRGNARPDDASETTYDIGAYESSYPETPADSIAPTTTAVLSPAANGDGWNNSDVTVTLSATDNEGGSGVKEITYSATGAQPIESTTVAGASASIKITAEGQTTLSYFATDNTGNVEVGQTVIVKLGKTSPTTAAVVSPAANAAGWNNSDVTVTLTTDDVTGGSGVKATYYSVNDGAQQTYDSSKGIVVSTEGQYTITYWSVDNAGNIETAKTLTVKLDKTPPTVSCGSSDGQWHANNVSIACTASDSGGSGLANSADASFSLTTNVPAGTETANAATDSRIVTDLAGNSMTAGPIVGNKVDRKAPTITITTPSEGANYLYGKSDTANSANYSATDGGSGVKTVDGSVPNGSGLGGSVGKHDFSVTATDNVGNIATSPTVHYTVTYEWSGILQPVNADDSSVFKLGSTVPVKFQLTQASTGVSDAVVKLYITKFDNSIEGTVLEVSSTAAADSGNTFRYDNTSKQYIFNLGTKGLTAGTYKLKLYVGGDNTTGVLQGEVIISLKK